MFCSACVECVDASNLVKKKMKLIVLCALVVCGVQGQYTMFQSVLDYYRQAFNIPSRVARDVNQFSKEYDFVVVGAGSGGCVVANRLTENPEWSVLLLEAGKEELLMTDIPLLVSYIIGTEYNWGYSTEPQDNACLSMNYGRCNWPRGKAMGGTSVINYMVYTRGFKEDYDHWANLGNPGWQYKQVLPYFLKSENIDVKNLMNSSYHARGGYLNVERPTWRTVLATSFMKAGNELGYKVGDTEGLTPLGFSYVLSTTFKGARMSASKAFIRPISTRKNIFVAKRARATKILVDQTTKQAYGVEFVKNRKLHRVLARKEVILAAGALNSPQLLMLSGIGPREHLADLKIPVIQDLRVGDNLQDHVSMAGLAFLVNDTVSVVEGRYRNPIYFFDYLINGRGPLTLPGGAEAHAFVSTPSNANKNHPNMELVFGPGAFTGDTGGSLRYSFNINDTFYTTVYQPYETKDAFNVVPVLLKPRSRGQVRLRSKNPFHWPLLFPNYYSHPEDLRAIVEGIKEAVRIGTSKPFQRYGVELLRNKFPGCEGEVFGTDSYWACSARHLTTNLHHQVGTCKMGPRSDPESVVDAQLKVHGIQGLRVVDASIMPTIPAGHTNSIVMMIGEKASDMIKQTWSTKL